MKNTKINFFKHLGNSTIIEQLFIDIFLQDARVFKVATATTLGETLIIPRNKRKNYSVDHYFIVETREKE